MASERLEEGALLGGRYEILGVVGRGGMGTVYRALDTRLDTPVAVKEMIDRADTEEERAAALRQFEREAKMLAQISHPNLPRVTDYFVEGDRCYLVMQFVEGRTLDELMRDRDGRPLPLQDVLDWGVQLADVLDYLHKQDPPIVFRDMKPANIMLQNDGTIKLIDFGIARRFQSGQTKDTLLYGSPGYSPPEQYGRAQTEPRSDLYALGATLHHLVTGRDPSPTPFKFPPIRSVNPDLPQLLETFLVRCLEMEEEKRCQTADEAREALKQIRSQALTDAMVARPPTGPNGPAPGRSGVPTGPRVTSRRLARADEMRFVRRLAAAGAVLALVLGGGALAWEAARHRGPTPTPHVIVTPTPKPAAPPHSSVPPPAADTSEAAQTATLRVNSIPPGAQIALDGTTAGVTPTDIPDVTPGRHTVRISPTPGSGFAAALRTVNVRPPSTTLDTQLSAAPQDAGGPPAAEVSQVEAQPTTLQDPTRPGLRLGVTLRVTGAAGKKCTVALYFFGPDQATPLKPSADAPDAASFATADGQLSVSDSFTVQSDAVDIIEYPLLVPLAAFPIPAGQASYRVGVFIGDTLIRSTAIQPLSAPASAPGSTSHP